MSHSQIALNAVNNWIYSSNELEFNTYCTYGAVEKDSGLVQCIFLDLIDHSEAE